jgi:hypothetical protein
MSAVRRPRRYLLARRWWRANAWLVVDLIDTAAVLLCTGAIAFLLLLIGD